MKPVIAITTGDPFGVGPEISLEAAATPRVQAVCRPLLIGDRRHLLSVARRLPGGPAVDPEGWPDMTRSGLDEWGSKQGDVSTLGGWSDGPAFNDMGDLGSPAPEPRGPTPAGGRASVQYVKQAVALVRAGSAAAIVTAPISKAAMQMAGHRYPGHTELLGDLCGFSPEGVAMLFVAPDLKVALLTTHLSLAEAIASLSGAAIEARLRLVHDEHLRWFGGEPRIGVCALNPHAGEEGLFGREEREIIGPAVEAARAAGVEARGPFPADTLFVRAGKGEFDVVLALYHDQATIPIKARSFGSAVNMTLGLPLLRTSVDHGTAYDLAGRGEADPGSLIEAILLAARLLQGSR
jgi:4-hydroxythreonine-4-phosphate dehydrogenase